MKSKDGASTITIYDVAREAGVSIGTVSRVFNKRRDVSAASRAKVLEAAKRLGYMPQLTARRITLGLVMQDIQKVHEVAYIGTLLCELANHAARRGVGLEIVPLKDLESVYVHHLGGLIGVLFGRAAESLGAIEHIPVLLINNVPGRGAFHTVAADHAEGARLAAQYLLERGHRRIVAVNVESSDWGSRERERGYREAFAAAGVPAPKQAIACLDGRSIETVFDPLLRQEPTAVVVFGEDLSIAMTDTLIHRLKVRIPDEISLLTYEVPLVSRLQTPPQTTIAQPWTQIARQAIDVILVALRTGNPEPRHVLLPNRLIERASVRDLRV